MNNLLSLTFRLEARRRMASAGAILMVAVGLACACACANTAATRSNAADTEAAAQAAPAAPAAQAAPAAPATPAAPAHRCAHLLESGEQPIQLTAYLSLGVPAEIEAIAQEVRRVLGDLHAASAGRITYEEIDPARHAEEQETTTDIFGRTIRTQTPVERGITALGIQPFAYQMVEDDMAHVAHAYSAVAGRAGDRTATAPLLTRADDVEFEINRLVYRLLRARPVVIGFAVGHGEIATDADLARFSEHAKGDYSLRPVVLSETASGSSLPDVDALVIAGNTEPYPERERAVVERWIAASRPIALLLRSVEVDAKFAAPISRAHGWGGILGGLGIRATDQIVLDAQCATLNIQTSLGSHMLNTPVKYPPIPAAGLVAGSPLERGVQMLTLPMATPLFVEEVPGALRAEIHASSSEQSGLAAPTAETLAPQRRWTSEEMSLGGPYPLVVTLHGPGDATWEVDQRQPVDPRIAIVGSADMLREEFAGPTSLAFLLNLFDWLTLDRCLLNR